MEKLKRICFREDYLKHTPRLFLTAWERFNLVWLRRDMESTIDRYGASQFRNWKSDLSSGLSTLSSSGQSLVTGANQWATGSWCLIQMESIRLLSGSQTLSSGLTTYTNGVESCFRCGTKKCQFLSAHRWGGTIAIRSKSG